MKFGSDIQSLIFGLNESQRNEFIELITKWKSDGLSKIGEYSNSFTPDEIIESIITTTKFERNQKKKDDASSKVLTTIPKNNWGVHRTHCCIKHGCKYGDSDCPVELALVEQDYDCESCVDEDIFEEFNGKQINRKEIYKRKIRNIKLKSLI